MGAMYTTPIAKNRFSQERFPAALKGLMDERHLSYRQLAYKTKLSAGYLNHLTKGTRPVPADPVIAVIAEALCVEADFFLEYRLRQVADVLDRAPALADKLYGILLRRPARARGHRRGAERSGQRARPRRTPDGGRQLLTRAASRHRTFHGRPRAGRRAYGAGIQGAPAAPQAPEPASGAGRQGKREEAPGDGGLNSHAVLSLSGRMSRTMTLMKKKNSPRIAHSSGL